MKKGGCVVEFYIDKDLDGGECWEGPFKTEKKARARLKEYLKADTEAGRRAWGQVFYVVKQTRERIS